MAASKIGITLDNNLLKQIDNLVKSNIFPNRSKAIQEAIIDKLNRIESKRLAEECAKLDTYQEQALAEEGFSVELDEWPEY